MNRARSTEVVPIGSRGAVEICGDAVKNDKRSTWEKIARELPDGITRWPVAALDAVEDRKGEGE